MSEREDTSNIEGTLGSGLASSKQGGVAFDPTQTRSKKGEASLQETKGSLTRALTSATSRKVVGVQERTSPRKSKLTRGLLSSRAAPKTKGACDCGYDACDVEKYGEQGPVPPYQLPGPWNPAPTRGESRNSSLIAT
jgi:hypothetical protein